MWLQISPDSAVNLIHVECVKIVAVAPGDFRVTAVCGENQHTLYADSDRTKCVKWLQTLMDGSHVDCLAADTLLPHEESKEAA